MTILASINIYLFIVFIFNTLLFMYGYFPINITTKKAATFSDYPLTLNNFTLKYDYINSTLPTTVLMIIDALRTDFVQNNANMTYTKSAADVQKSCIYTIKVHPPTVTLPRLKALTSGTIPSFIDVILNFGNAQMSIDSFLRHMFLENRKINFYGDNTWTKMFPHEFYRVEETRDSFFVNDFYEGDINITNNINIELTKTDWNMLIVHFLGLDHIGHVEGPFSKKVPEKLKEMDVVISNIDKQMQKRDAPYMFFVTGDHGMRDAGGHGGNSHWESHVPLVVFGMNCTNSEEIYEQSDICTTLSLLLGLPIPSSSIGSVITELIEHLTASDQLSILYYSTLRLYEQISNSYDKNDLIEKVFYQQFKNATFYHSQFLARLENDKKTDGGIFQKALLFYKMSSRAMTQILAESYLTFDMLTIYVAIFLNVVTFVTFFLNLSIGFHNPENFKFNVKSFFIFALIYGVMNFLLCKATACDSYLCPSKLSSVLLNVLVLIFNYGNFFILASAIDEKKVQMHADKGFLNNFALQKNPLELLMFLSVVYHAVSYSSSSFIEEEHQTWYYFSNTLFIILFVQGIRKNVYTETDWTLPSNCDAKLNIFSNKNTSNILRWITFFTVHLFLRRLNQTGDKWLSIPDIGDWLVLSENKFYLSCFMAFGLVWMIYECRQFCGMLTTILISTASLLIYYHRTITGMVSFIGLPLSSSKTSILLFWINIVEIICIIYIPLLSKFFLNKRFTRAEVKVWLGSNVFLFCIISALLQKPHNLILNAACLMTCGFINKLCDVVIHDSKRKVVFKILGHIWIGKLFYFYQGNSNNLATIDVNAGFVGLDTFNILTVGIFLTINVYSGVLLSYLVLIFNLFQVEIERSNQRSFNSNILLVIPIVMLTICAPIAVYLVLLAVLRHHLFIWTVFAPKLIYEMYHMCLVFMFVMFVYGLHKATNKMTK